MPSASRGLLKRCRSGRATGVREGMALVGVLSTQLWHEAFCGAEADGYPPETAEPRVRIDRSGPRLVGRERRDDANGDIRKGMRGYIEENFLYLRPDVDLEDGDDFLMLGIVDSLGFVELVEEVQSRFGVSIDDIEITEENFGSIDAIAAFVERKRAAA